MALPWRGRRATTSAPFTAVVHVPLASGPSKSFAKARFPTRGQPKV